MSGGRRYKIARDLHKHIFNERTIDVVRAWIDGTRYRGAVEKPVADAVVDVMEPIVDYVIESRKDRESAAWKQGYRAGWDARKDMVDTGEEQL